MPQPTLETPIATQSEWKVGDLLHVQYTPSPALKIAEVAENGIVYAIYDDDDTDHPVGILTRSGRIIRMPGSGDKVRFIKTTSFDYPFTDLPQLRADWKKGMFDGYFGEEDERSE
ncbi:hypothetical protein [Spirosoma aerophilum]